MDAKEREDPRLGGVVVDERGERAVKLDPHPIAFGQGEDARQDRLGLLRRQALLEIIRASAPGRLEPEQLQLRHAPLLGVPHELVEVGKRASRQDGVDADAGHVSLEQPKRGVGHGEAVVPADLGVGGTRRVDAHVYLREVREAAGEVGRHGAAAGGRAWGQPPSSQSASDLQDEGISEGLPAADRHVEDPGAREGFDGRLESLPIERRGVRDALRVTGGAGLIAAARQGPVDLDRRAMLGAARGLGCRLRAPHRLCSRLVEVEEGGGSLGHGDGPESLTPHTQAHGFAEDGREVIAEASPGHDFEASWVGSSGRGAGGGLNRGSSAETVAEIIETPARPNIRKVTSMPKLLELGLKPKRTLVTRGRGLIAADLPARW